MAAFRLSFVGDLLRPGVLGRLEAHRWTRAYAAALPLGVVCNLLSPGVLGRLEAHRRTCAYVAAFF